MLYEQARFQVRGLCRSLSRFGSSRSVSARKLFLRLARGYCFEIHLRADLFEGSLLDQRIGDGDKHEIAAFLLSERMG
jgi:hypothetical protein